jgi:alpha-tubulin suppressor-like RCC1 family protein
VDTASLVPGGTIALTAVIADAQGQVLDERPVEWALSNSSRGAIAIVGTASHAQVTANAAGPLTVYVTREGVIDSLRLSVQPVSYTRIAVGSAFSCGLTAQDVAWCWGGGGGNEYRQLGRKLGYLEKTPAAVVTGLRFKLLAAGAAHVCGLVASGAAYCWGANFSGQLGDGTKIDRPFPVPVTGGLVFDTLVAGDQVTCGLTGSGAGYCWGGTAAGELGSGSQNSMVPVAIAGGHNFTMLSTAQKSIEYSQVHTCGLDGTGAVWCWGSNYFGQLGDSSQVDKSTPVLVRGGHSFEEIGTGDEFTCGRATGGTVFCWGSNFRYTVAAPLDSSVVLVPRQVQGMAGISRLQSGAQHTCVLDGSGQGQCWGDNLELQLGSGLDDSYPRAILPIAGGHSFVTFEAGNAHTCGITSLGRTLCWGSMGGKAPTAVIGQP